MKIRNNAGMFFFLAFVCLAGCSKKDTGTPGNGNGGNTSYGSGTLYFDWATEGLLKIDLSTGSKATVLPENTGRYGWDISLDGKKMLQCTEAPGNDYDANLYTLTNIADGTIITQFKYYPAGGDYTIPYLSPDASLIAVAPTYDDGLVIMDLQGHVQHNLTSYKGVKLGSTVVWMPDGTLLFSAGNGLYRTNKTFNAATLVKQLNFDSWGDVTASRDGSKIVLKGGNHIWLMNADGTNLVQVTQSSAVEAAPVFSPDGRFLLIGTQYHQTGPFGYIWDLAIIPADGQQYNVDDGADKRVTPVIAKGDRSAQASDGNMEWR